MFGPESRHNGSNLRLRKSHRAENDKPALRVGVRGGRQQAGRRLDPLRCRLWVTGAPGLVVHLLLDHLPVSLRTKSRAVVRDD